MSKSNDSILVPLFGDNDDMRTKLFINELRNSADAVRGNKSYRHVTYQFVGTVVNKFGNVQLTEVTKGLQNRFFKTPTPSRADDEAHAEWDEYFCDLHDRIAGKSLSRDAIDVIKQFAGAADIGTEKEFAQAVIRSVVASLSGAAGADVDINRVSTWGNATNGTYHDATKLAWHLIEPNIDKLTKLPFGASPIGKASTTGKTKGSVSSVVSTDVGTKIFTPDVDFASTTRMPDMTFILDDMTSGTKISKVNGLHETLKDGCGSSREPSGKKEFTYRYDKYWLKSMLESHVAAAKMSVAPSSFFDDAKEPADEVYYRKGSELFTHDADGKEVRVDIGSSAYLSLTMENKCLGTGFVSGASGSECADYLRDCLAGKDVNKCKTYLADEKYWDKAVNEVKNMLPTMAVQTLNAFEFGMEQVWDNTAARRLLKYKSVTSWLQNLGELAKSTSSKMTTGDVEKIAKNTKLIGYLEMLVKKVNSNPAILNKEYTGLSDASRINDPDAFAGSRLHKMGIKARLATSNLSVSSVDKLSQAIKDSNSRVGITIGYPGLYGFTTKLNLMNGGGVIEELETKLSDVTKQTGHIIERHYLALDSRLKKHGKEISAADQAKILDLIQSLKKSEEKLYQAILYTEKYASLLEVHGQKDNTNVLSMDHLKQFVDNRNKYFARVSKKQNDLMSIIRSIAEAVNKETPSPDAEMKSINVDPKEINFAALLG